MIRRLRIVFAAGAAFILAACSPVTWFNLTVPRGGYSVHRDLAYGGDARQKLDIYVPDSLKAPAPVILFFYGGNWRSGSKADYLAFGEAFASEGFIVAVADYRLAPQVKFPAFVEDSASAFRFIRDHVEAYGGDKTRIFIAGHSAGAYNAIMLVSDPRYLKAAGADIGEVRGAIGLAGPYDFLPLTDPALIDLFGGSTRPETQPIHFIDGIRPPMLLAAGANDETVLPRNTITMGARLRSFGSPVVEKIYPKTGHIGLLLSLTRLFRRQTTLHADMAAFVRTH
jgi:acetyl esterase/lipase